MNQDDNNIMATDLSEFMCFALYSTHHAMHRLNKQLLHNLGLTYTQFIVMVALWNEDNQLVSDIGKKVYLESNTLTPLLKRLENRQYIKRTRDVDDERKVRISLTDSGKQIKDHTMTFSQTILKASKMDKKAFKDLLDQVTTLRENLIAFEQ